MTEYHQLLVELDCLNISNFHETLEVTVLGHYYLFCVKNLWNFLYFIHQDISVSKARIMLGGNVSQPPEYS